MFQAYLLKPLRLTISDNSSQPSNCLGTAKYCKQRVHEPSPKDYTCCYKKWGLNVPQRAVCCWSFPINSCVTWGELGSKYLGTTLFGKTLVLGSQRAIKDFLAIRGRRVQKSNRVSPAVKKTSITHICNGDGDTRGLSLFLPKERQWIPFKRVDLWKNSSILNFSEGFSFERFSSQRKHDRKGISMILSCPSSSSSGQQTNMATSNSGWSQGTHGCFLYKYFFFFFYVVKCHDTKIHEKMPCNYQEA